MPDRIAAEIWIGGKLPRRLLDEFPVSDLCLDWDGNRLQSTAEADILAARDEDGLLHFADVEAAWGEFEELEGWLREHSIPFRCNVPTLHVVRVLMVNELVAPLWQISTGKQ